MKTSTSPDSQNENSVYILAASQLHAERLCSRFATRFVAPPAVRAFTSAGACLAQLAQLGTGHLIVATDFDAAPALIRSFRQRVPRGMAIVVGALAGQERPLQEAGATILLESSTGTAETIVRLLLEAERSTVAAPLASLDGLSEQLLGRSPAMRRVFDLIKKAAAGTITVSLSGETGTGKEEVARAIHERSARAKGPFVALNMAAIPRDLLESELFGHEKGAFTNAVGRRIGHFEMATGGTLFLDEIADMDINLQAKLLRVLQEKKLTRVGGSHLLPFDVRLIIASHADLLQRVREGRFREDLYYRLLGLPIMLPPLRERPDDILLLATHFLRQFSPPGRSLRFSPAAQVKLLAYSYPGNVRELRAIVELAAVLTDTEVVEGEHLVFAPEADPPMPMAADVESHLTLKEHVNRIVQFYLDQNHGNVLAAAARLGIGKSTLYRMISSGQVRV